jgi:spore coat polysaccharide biosynthesis predicted glycosyltransferase SpsG
MEVVFLTCCEYPDLIERLELEGCRVLRVASEPDEHETVEAMEKEQPEWIVLDGFHFGEHIQRAIKSVGYRLLVLDDMAGFSHYAADIIVNQNLHADVLEYSCDPGTKRLLGTKYAILRREFRERKGLKRQIASAGEVRTERAFC